MDDAMWQKNRRILVVDDSDEIHNDFRRILRIDTGSRDLGELEAALFRETPTQKPVNFELTVASQGQEALAEVQRAKERGAPYALAFVDVRMPPGWDGIETLSRLWGEDPELQAVICSAYSDYSWDALVAALGQTDSLLILAKPFDPAEVRQMAFALTEKWNQRRALTLIHRRLSLQYAVTRILVEATSLAEGVTGLLRAVGEALGWPFGALWLVDERGSALHCEHTFRGPGGELAELEAASRKEPRVIGGGWPGLAFLRRESNIVADVSAAPGAEARAPLLARAGISCAIELPIRGKSADQVLGVLEFLSPDARPLTPELLETLTEICTRAGHFIEGKRVEEALRRSEAKNRALLDAIPDTILRLRADGTCVDFKAPRQNARAGCPTDLVDQPITRAFPEEVAEAMMQLVRRALGDGKAAVLEYAQPIDGEPRSFEARIAGSDAAEAVVIVRDITEQRRVIAEAEVQRAREETIRAQREALSALSTPLIPINDEIVVMPLIGALDAGRLAEVQERLVQGIVARRASMAILDITGVPSLSAEGAELLARAAQAARLLGAEVMITGLRPDVARTLVTLGVGLPGIATHQTLQSGIASAMKRR